jgi:hypothetical protein
MYGRRNSPRSAGLDGGRFGVYAVGQKMSEAHDNDAHLERADEQGEGVRREKIAAEPLVLGFWEALYHSLSMSQVGYRWTYLRTARTRTRE